MTDSIIVRVTLDSYDMASTGRQTQVYVQVPEVARASWLLPSDRFHGLKDRAWPEVLDVVNDYILHGWIASNSSSSAAWDSIWKWLAKDANRDELQAAFEEYEARRNPVARKLLSEAERLRARVAELEAGLPAMQKALLKALDRVAELEKHQGAAEIAIHRLSASVWRCQSDAETAISIRHEVDQILRPAVTETGGA
jgi:hypothetical protein